MFRNNKKKQKCGNHVRLYLLHVNYYMMANHRFLYLFFLVNRKYIHLYSLHFRIDNHIIIIQSAHIIPYINSLVSIVMDRNNKTIEALLKLEIEKFIEMI